MEQNAWTKAFVIFSGNCFSTFSEKKMKKNTLNLGYLFYAPNFKMLPFVCCLLFSVSCAVKSWKKNHTIFVEWVASKWTSRNFSNIRGGCLVKMVDNSWSRNTCQGERECFCWNFDLQKSYLGEENVAAGIFQAAWVASWAPSRKGSPYSEPDLQFLSFHVNVPLIFVRWATPSWK